MKPLVCIILLNYNTFDDTVECVESLMKIDYDNYKVILIDNASNDAEQIAADDYLNQNCDVILSHNNDGFSAGNNIGIRFAKKKYAPQYYLLLNNDTVVEPDVLSQLVNTSETAGPDIGIVTGQIRYYSDRSKANFKGGYFDRKHGMVGYYDTAKPVGLVKEVTFATGCLMLIPAIALDKVGLLDERFFMYGEDTNYCCRMIGAGLRILYCDTCIIYHKISASCGEGSDFKQYYIVRNNLYLIHAYSTNRRKAYCSYLLWLAKEIVRKRKKTLPVLRAWMAYLRHEKGRNPKY